jgi:hypothetical protein
MSGRQLWTAALWCCACWCLLPAHSHAQLKPTPTDSLQYRRVFVPADRVAEMASGYLPVKTAEFQQLLTAIGATPSTTAGSNVRLVDATYSARLEQNDLVGGQAQLRIACENTQEAILNLEPCSLAIRAPVWNTKGQPPARLGADAAGKLAVVVEAPAAGDQPNRESELRFAWSQRGARDPSGALVFDLETAACASARLKLDLPAGMTPVLSQGIVSQSSDVAPAADRKIWSLEFGGRTRIPLSIVADSALKRREQFVLLRQATTYHLAPQALETNVALHLSVYHEPLRQLTLQLDPALRITSVTAGDAPVTWDLVPSAANQARVVLDFAEPLTGPDCIVRIAALAPLKRDATWLLPPVRAEDVVWQEGTIQLQIDHDLELCDVAPQQAAQMGAVTTALPTPRESLSFQCLAVDAALNVLVRNRAVALACEEGLSLQWESSQLSGRLVSHFSTTEGSVYELRGDVAPGWIIDGVETVPPADVDYSTVAANGGTASPLKLRLAKPITSREPLEVKIVAHRRAPAANERLQPAEFRLVTWQDVPRPRRLVSVQTEAQQQLVVTGDSGLERIDPRQLSPAQRTRIDATSSRLIFSDTAESGGFGMHLRSERPRFTVESVSRYALSRDVLSEAHTIHVTPEAAPLSRLVVRFGAALPRPVQWDLGRETAGEMTVRQLAAENDELWELSFARPQTSPFTVVAERQTTLRPGDAARPVPVLIVNEAETQRGELLVTALEGAAPVVQQRGLKPAMIPTGDASLRAAFRYQPGAEQRLTLGHAAPVTRLAPAWAWQGQLALQINAAGQQFCTATYLLENTGEPQVVFKLPANSSLRQVRLDGVRLPLSASSTADLVVPLATDARYSTLRIEYGFPDIGHKLWQTVPLAFPETAMPVLRYDAQVWLAPELRLDHAADDDALTWRRRLFGPLARQDAAPPSLFSWDGWRQQLTGDALTQRQRARAQTCLLAWEVNLREARGNAASPTWGEWLEQYRQVENDGSLPDLMIDASALTTAGIFPETKLDNSTDSALETLQRSGAVLIIDDEHVLLTALPLLDRHEQLVPLATGVFVAGSRGENTRQGVPAQIWIAEPQAAHPPWQAASRATLVDLQAAGWTFHQISNEGGPRLTASLYRWQDIRAIAWGCFLASAGAFAVLARRRIRARLFAVAGLAIIALWLPAPFVPFATAAFLGTLAGSLGTLALSRGPSKKRAEVRRTASPSVSLAAPVIIGLAILVVNSTSGQEPAPAPRAPMPEIHRVIVPIDDKQQPSGDYVYLPRTFYDALARQAKNAKAVPQGWILYEANYRGRVQATMAGGKTQVSDLVATYDVEVFQPQTKVIIGLAREGLHLRDDHVNLEGESVRIEWLESGEGFVVPVEKAGRYRIEVAVRPTAKLVQGREQIDLRIPGVARANLELKTPVESGVQVAGARGHSTQDEPGSLQVELGPTTRLTLYWPTDEGNLAPADHVEAAQLLWWKINPGGAVLATKWKFKSSLPLAEVRLIADPRLRLLPLDKEQPVAEHSVREGDVQAIHVKLKEPHEREVTLEASFALADASGIGQLSLPRLEAVVDKTTQRWLGLSATDPIDASFEQAPANAALTPQEFSAAWASAELPKAAVRLADSAAPVVNARLKPAEVTAKQAVTFALDSARVRMEFEAIVDVDGGPVFQHRLQMPAEWQIDEALVTEGETARPLRVTSGTAGSRTVFLPGRTEGEHRLLVKASGPLKMGEWTLPSVGLTDTAGDPPLLFIERSSQLGAKIVEHSGYEAVADTTSPPEDLRWRRLAVLRPQAKVEARRVKLTLAPNTARLRAREIISVQREETAWEAIVHVACEAIDGPIEELRFELPADLSGMRVDAPARLAVKPLPGQARQQLIVSLDEARTGTFALQLMIPLAAATNGRLQAPDVRLLDCDALGTLVVLPTMANNQNLAWETRGLQTAERPPDDLLPVGVVGQLFTATSERFQAVLQRVERAAGVPQVRLAEVATHVDRHGKSYGIAAFDLEPAGLSACRLRLPADQTLVQVFVNGVPASARFHGPREVEVLLHHEQLPQHVEALFLAMPEALQTGATLAIAAPSLAQLPIERSLWTVTTPEDVRLTLADDGVAADAARRATLRLKNSAALLEHAAGQATDVDADQLPLWLARWLHRSHQTDVMIAHESDHTARNSSVASEQQALVEVAQTIATQWNAAAALTAPSNHPAAATSLTDVASPPSDAQASTIATVLPGSTSTVRVVPNLPVSMVQGTRVAGVLVVVACLCFAMALTRTRIPAEISARAPHAVGVAAGIVWWLILSPPGLGLFIVLLFAIAALRWPYSSTSPPASSPRPTFNRPR